MGRGSGVGGLLIGFILLVITFVVISKSFTATPQEVQQAQATIHIGFGLMPMLLCIGIPLVLAVWVAIGMNMHQPHMNIADAMEGNAFYDEIEKAYQKAMKDAIRFTHTDPADTGDAAYQQVHAPTREDVRNKKYFSKEDYESYLKSYFKGIKIHFVFNMFRGHDIEFVKPGNHISLQLEAHRRGTYKWYEIVKITHDGRPGGKVERVYRGDANGAAQYIDDWKNGE